MDLNETHTMARLKNKTEAVQGSGTERIADVEGVVVVIVLVVLEGAVGVATYPDRPSPRWCPRRPRETPCTPPPDAPASCTARRSLSAPDSPTRNLGLPQWNYPVDARGKLRTHAQTRAHTQKVKRKRQNCPFGARLISCGSN